MDAVELTSSLAFPGRTNLTRNWHNALLDEQLPEHSRASSDLVEVSEDTVPEKATRDMLEKIALIKRKMYEEELEHKKRCTEMILRTRESLLSKDREYLSLSHTTGAGYFSPHPYGQLGRRAGMGDPLYGYGQFDPYSYMGYQSGEMGFPGYPYDPLSQGTYGSDYSRRTYMDNAASHRAIYGS
ncbi:MAG: hypothetical protein HYU64_00940 [Armatimonadetes bacterium]|nr:hypothetical protein [Armatimonadota bacterium]